jgi:hypothetical protein
MAQLTK